MGRIFNIYFEHEGHSYSALVTIAGKKDCDETKVNISGGNIQIQLPNGRMVKVAYTADAPPLIAARIQDLYGIKEGLWIAQRRVPVRIQVLAPSNRPVQVTDNLSLFWRETYPKLKTQLQRRYPKHEWR